MSAPRLLVVLGVALAYLAIGRLSLMLAIPPGYAAPVWPPAGIAVAAILLVGGRAWPGVALGSVLVNASAASGFEPFVAVVAAGATLQALLGAWLVRRFVGWPQRLIEARPILAFLALAGPVSCVVNATVATWGLAAAGQLPGAEVAFHWFTWWAGDSVGAIVFAPLVLAAADPAFPGGARRRAAVALPLLGMFAALTAIYVYASRLESREIQRDFDGRAAALARVLDRELSAYVEVLDSVGRFWLASERVTPREFEAFAQGALARRAGVRAIEWVAVVRQAEVPGFERQAAAAGDPGFRIRELDASGRLVPASPRPVYYPVLYAVPLERNARAIGYDLGSEPHRRAAMMQAVEERRTVASDPVRLVQQVDRHPEVLVFHPVESRQGRLTGFALAVVNAQAIVEGWLAQADVEGLSVELFLVDGPGDRHVVFADPRAGQRSGLLATQTRSVVGRHWEVVVWSGADYLRRHRSMQSWSLLAGGVLFTGLLGAFLLAVTGQVTRTEQVVRERTDALGQMARRMELILDSVGEGIYGTDLEGRCTFVNPVAARTTGYASQDLIGRDVHALLHGTGDPRLCPADPCPLVAPLQDGRVRNGAQQQFRRSDGEVFPVEYVASPLSEEGRVVGGVVAFRDITERRAIERMKDEFISVVSHELRTPLTAIRGSMGLVAGGKAGDVPPQAQRMIDLALRNVDRLVRLINDILDLERLRSGQACMERRPCEADALMAQAAEEVRPVAEQAAIRVEVEPSGAAVLADPDRIVQVLTNLLGNAVKFSSAGGTVRLSAEKNGGVTFRVRDEGRGIPPEDVGRIFERFHQVDSSDSREKGGTGLGLAICRSIVEQHGGRIWAESQVGRGSTFCFTLPTQSPTAGAAVDNQEEPWIVTS